MKNFSLGVLILLIVLVTHCLEAEAQVCRPSGKIKGIKPPPGQCNQENEQTLHDLTSVHHVCRVTLRQFLLSTVSRRMEMVEDHQSVITSTTPITRQLTVVALPKGWYNKGRRCLNNTTISANGRSVDVMVVDECDSTMGCDEDHDYQPPFNNNIVDASKAVWEALGVPSDNWGELDITWSEARN